MGACNSSKPRRFGIGCLAERKDGRLLFTGSAALEQANEIVEHRACRERADAAPQFRTYGPRRRPAFVRVITEHSAKGRVPPTVQSDDGR